MDFLKRYPIPIAGLILELFALGNLIQSYSADARLALGVIAFVLYVPYLLKVAVLNVKLREPLDNPVAAVVAKGLHDFVKDDSFQHLFTNSNPSTAKQIQYKESCMPQVQANL